MGAFAQIMRLKSDARVDSWLKRRPGTIVEIDREMVRLTLDILSSTLFSDALDEDRPGFEREMMKLLDAIGRIDPLDVLNAPDWMPRLNRRSAQQSREWFAGTSERLIAQRSAEIARAPDRAPDDLLTALLRASDPETGIGLSHEEVAANLFTFIAAGHETTARALAWTLHLLSRAPEWQERVREEAANAPDDPAEWPDAMPATRAVFEESMRLFPPVPHMSRMALDADRLGDTDVPAKSIIIVAPWLLHRHKRLWTQPGAFMPERFHAGRAREDRPLRLSSLRRGPARVHRRDVRDAGGDRGAGLHHATRAPHAHARRRAPSGAAHHAEAGHAHPHADPSGVTGCRAFIFA